MVPINIRSGQQDFDHVMLSLRLLTIIAGFAFAGSASAASIGIVAPQSGPYELLGQQVRQGAKAAAAKLGLDVVEIHESCEDGSGGAIADGLVAAKVSAAIGFLCTETLQDVLPPLKAAAIPAITLSSRAPILMEDALKYGWPLFRLAPSDRAESARAAEVILRDWKGHPIGLVDDGTIYSRELVDRIRSTLEENGLKPTFADTMRPNQEQQVALVRRLARTGITHVFIGAERNDIAVVARDAASENFPLTILGGDTLNAANTPLALAANVMAITRPAYDTLPSAQGAAGELRAAGIEPEGYVLPAYAATELTAALAEAAQAQSKPAPEILASGTAFKTVIGDLAFNPSHELSDNPYRLQRWNGQRFEPADKAERQ
ncbi:ABC transporter substrate-binding protein [Rhizobium pusense]|uniref:ABC transporter substrate-binding protein n=1 Tax=Hyphomicrobiales TaxID=356 RepID=UPI00031F4732|nr:ABC transporter substrate-binding protein [Agrobacterium pusense]KIV68248.1 branched-chain amino acid ABC transporter, periplasmic amino acid-binding protein, putative [Rhizobium sp. UR51a]MCZ7929467.1 ABC transporter substrate-binding protein [Agrobacterium pusense]MDH0114733.1 ABC transporter substrate-binding protein [Agrobacterium pusense]MDH1111612.1 ABC transporter substrate-binding protein [Agrobacterium pusense]WMW54471.1 ABC transporter substrate-binding protein [Agrobacterium puse